MEQIHIPKIAKTVAISENQVRVTLELFEEGATVPFIARYRKERTGSLDEVQITAIRDLAEQLAELDKRKTAVLKSIEEQEKLTPELKKQIEAAETITAVEDIYLPYKPKRKTRASVAKEKGLEPLAHILLEQDEKKLQQQLNKFINPEKGVADAEEALAGARDIVAETVNEDLEVRNDMRKLFEKKAQVKARVITGKEKETDAQKYRDYFEWDEPLKDIPSHRLLALRRAEKEGFIMLDSFPEDEEAIHKIEKRFEPKNNAAGEQIKLALKDAYKRLLKPSMETEVRLLSKQKADEEAIRVFADNLRQLLLAAPLGQKRVLAIDPGFRTGCKVVCLDNQGKLIYHTAIFPNEPQKQVAEATSVVISLCTKYDIDAIAIGNATASRETERFVRSIKQLPAKVQILMVNESGASIYSASEVAREEFPNEDLTVRGAVSIGRRLMDPLAELVKLDPKSIGVGQYQHDVDQKQLKHSLDDTVVSCVNGVGVEVNTASKELLSYVSGLGPALAKNIVTYRNENGAFKSRKELLKVQRLGTKAFEQAAGFLRIRDAKDPLDSSAVHPESYHIVRQMAKDLGATVSDLIESDALRKKIDLKKYVNDKVGMPTLQDIMQELARPGRDPREKFETFAFAEGIEKPEDLQVGMKLPGIVTNITNFGAFVDIGVHQDGLVHISHMADKFVSDPNEVLKVSQRIEPTVIDIDLPRKRIALSLKADPFGNSTPSKKQAKLTPKDEPKQDMKSKLSALRNMFKKN
ncbi:MAG: RNA-binding transcriptional accessory protein [Bernardetiaceae bacterium]|nr:RNA-binding transcriptional accessory protein [Bernardetiaceae bacterium]